MVSTAGTLLIVQNTSVFPRFVLSAAPDRRTRGVRWRPHGHRPATLRPHRGLDPVARDARFAAGRSRPAQAAAPRLRSSLALLYWECPVGRVVRANARIRLPFGVTPRTTRGHPPRGRRDRGW